ncbi:MAG: class I SAM-dependent methyltransferase [Solirubrobacterales bacterium]
MSFYEEKIFPYLMNKIIGNAEIIEHRRQLLSKASGRVLEIGIGTGLNLNLYPAGVAEIAAVDPYPRELPPGRVKVDLYPDNVESMRFEDSTFDTVVSTFTLCSVENLPATIQEIKRVLKPNGKYLFLEHGKAVTRFAQRLQDAANPLYNVFACGCNINRDYRQVITASGFRIEKYALHSVNIVPAVLTGYLYEGVVRNEKHQTDL